MEQGRFDTIACMVHDGKKAAAEADTEISEAIDFARYYAEFRPHPGLAHVGAGSRGGHAAVEFSLCDTLRRCPGRADGGKRRRAQARAGNGGDRVAFGATTLAGRHPAR
jgi:hypothetical protein